VGAEPRHLNERDVMGRQNVGGKVESGDAYKWIVPTMCRSNQKAINRFNA
jgi:hypothetical protein